MKKVASTEKHKRLESHRIHTAELACAKHESNMVRAMAMGNNFNSSIGSFNPVSFQMLANNTPISVPRFEENSSVESIDVPSTLHFNKKSPKSRRK